MLRVLDKINRHLNQIMVIISGFFLGAMIILTCSNIFFRLFWMPVRGTFELMGYFGAIVTAFSLSYTQFRKGHIAVDILVNRFSKKTRKVLNTINYIISMIFFSVAGWQIIQWGLILKRSGEVTETLRIIYYPFTFGVAFGCGAIAFVLMVDWLNFFIGEKETE